MLLWVRLRKSERESEKRELKEAGQVKHPHLLHHVYQKRKSKSVEYVCIIIRTFRIAYSNGLNGSCGNETAAVVGGGGGIASVVVK